MPKVWALKRLITSGTSLVSELIPDIFLMKKKFQRFQSYSLRNIIHFNRRSVLLI
jgi:hypothetical protein